MKTVPSDETFCSGDPEFDRLLYDAQLNSDPEAWLAHYDALEAAGRLLDDPPDLTTAPAPPGDEHQSNREADDLLRVYEFLDAAVSDWRWDYGSLLDLLRGAVNEAERISKRGSREPGPVG